MARLTKEEAKRRIEKLKKEINRYRYAYHVLDKELISADALDSLKKELFDLEHEFPEFVTPDSPTQRVEGKPLKAFKKVPHERPMISFDDSFSEEDMKEWLLRLENFLGKDITEAHEALREKPYRKGDRKPPLFYDELKIDGLAIELVYERGVLTQGSTRGNGLIGEDVTQNLKTIEAIPLNLLPPDEVAENLKKMGIDPKPYTLYPRRLVVRGEAFITKQEFERINREQAKNGGKLYANPRNIAAGSIRQLDPAVTASRKLDSFQYALFTDIGQKFHEEEHLLLKAFGFKTNPHNKPVNSLKEIFEFRDYWADHRGEIPYEIDGTVVVVNSNRIFDAAGVAGKAPRGAMAYKFSPKEATTKVLDIVVQVGRTGVLTPVAVMEPVNVGGVTITHATLHNEDEVGRLDLRIGDTVVVSRAGDVIPQVTEVLRHLRTGHERRFKMPERCPVDGGNVQKIGALTKCMNPDCGAKHRESLYHFVSRAAFDIRGLGPKILDTFMDEGLIADAADIFELKEGDIEALPRFGEKSAENIVREVGEKKKVVLSRFLYALGILHVGEETASLLAQAISKSKFQISKPINVGEAAKSFSLEELQALPDIGPIVAKSIYDWFRSAKNKKLMEKLEKAGVEIEHQKRAAQAERLKGKTFVLTGTLSSMSRDEAKDKIRERGGDVSETVSKTTTSVVVGENPGSKYDKAKKLGVRILNEEEFRELIG
ncbi:NAD-dependent DNA ligase LigA [Patescibacteria group bacterium]|nr:NAD-dependent DNA ligase LigA [Patescibacteria group bacterium]MCL5114582.1 NAD-dependent DNA ligase LigA [Patescibacteria group bacterium]